MANLPCFVVIIGNYDGQWLKYAIIPRLTDKYIHKDQWRGGPAWAIRNTPGGAAWCINQSMILRDTPHPRGIAEKRVMIIYYIYNISHLHDFHLDIWPPNPAISQHFAASTPPWNAAIVKTYCAGLGNLRFYFYLRALNILDYIYLVLDFTLILDST